MADDVVDRGADRLLIAVVSDVGRGRLLHIDDMVVAQPVQLFGRHARLDVLRDHVEDLGGQRAGPAGHGDLFGGADCDESFGHHANSAKLTACTAVSLEWSGCSAWMSSWQISL